MKKTFAHKMVSIDNKYHAETTVVNKHKYGLRDKHENKSSVESKK